MAFVKPFLIKNQDFFDEGDFQHSNASHESSPVRGQRSYPCPNMNNSQDVLQRRFDQKAAELVPGMLGTTPCCDVS